MSQGVRNEPSTLPITTSMMAAASSPPAFRVITTFDAIVVGMQLATIIPTSTLGSMAPERTPPAAITICTMTDDRALERTFSFLISPLRRYTHRDRSRYEEFPF